MDAMALLWMLLGLLVFLVLLRLFNFVWLRPRKIERFFLSQGIMGPCYRIFVGNATEMVKMMKQASFGTMDLSHDILPRVLPFYHHWTKTYGRTFLMWFGPTARVNIRDPEMVREVLSLRYGSYEKTEANTLERRLEGDGLLNLKGDKWVQHRRIVNPAFRMEHLRALMPVMAESVKSMLDVWEKSIGSGTNEIEVSSCFQDLSADVIARTAFGTSYEEGKEIFHMQSEQMTFAVEAFQNVFLPLFRFLPTKKNRYQWKLDREIRKRMGDVIRKREEDPSCGTDLLGLMINAKVQSSLLQQQQQQQNQRRKNQRYSAVEVHDIMEEFKTFFFAGRQTTSTLLTWTTVLLSVHRDWQSHARKQVLEVCGHAVPDKNSITELRILDMIVNESLRLYPPVVAMIRKTTRATRLEKLLLPEEMELLLPILAIHHDKSLWGEDAYQFNPGRFQNGVSQAAKHPMAFLPFGAGPRTCIGRNFAITEAKIALAMMLQRLEFRISPNYRHAPSVLMMLYPQFGAQILFSRLNQPM